MITPAVALAGAVLIAVATPRTRDARTAAELRAAVRRAGLLRCAIAATWALMTISATGLEASLPNLASAPAYPGACSEPSPTCKESHP